VIAYTVTPLPVLSPADDLTAQPADAARGFTTQVDTDQNGNLAVVYRSYYDNACYARVYGADPADDVPSFYVSPDGANDNLSELYTTFDPVGGTYVRNDGLLGGASEIPFAGLNAGGNDGKAALCYPGLTLNADGDSILGVMWLTSSAVASANTTDTLCNGQTKSVPVSNAIRIFRVISAPTDVPDWDLY